MLTAVLLGLRRSVLEIRVCLIFCKFSLIFGGLDLHSHVRQICVRYKFCKENEDLEKHRFAAFKSSKTFCHNVSDMRILKYYSWDIIECLCTMAEQSHLSMALTSIKSLITDHQFYYNIKVSFISKILYLDLIFHLQFITKSCQDPMTVVNWLNVG